MLILEANVMSLLSIRKQTIIQRVVSEDDFLIVQGISESSIQYNQKRA